MTGLRQFTREQWMQLRPETYLADGYLDPAGAPRPELVADYATAAATQLMADELSPQELALTVEGIRQILPLHAGDPSERLMATLEEALSVVARAIQQTNNRGMVQWLNTCASAVDTEQELAAFIAHAQAVVRVYGLLVGLLPESSGSLQ